MPEAGLKENGKAQDNEHHHQQQPQQEQESRPAAYNVGSDDFILVEEVGLERTSVKQKIVCFLPWFAHKTKSTCTVKNILKRLPILNWLPKYNAQDAIGDFVAGITVGLTVVPQSLAYANIAGIHPRYGLYSSFLGTFMYIFLGSCKDVPMGPTAIISLLTYQTLQPNLGPDYATLLCFLCGLIQLVMGLAGLGIIIDFVSGPVSSGFTSAVAMLIVMSQLKDILGIKGGGTTFPEMLTRLVDDIHNTRIGDMVLGISCILILLLLRLMSDMHFGPTDEKNPSKMTNFLNKALWIIGTSRNAIVVLACSILGAYVLNSNNKDLFKFIGEIPAGLPSVGLPPFSTNGGNTTFVEMVHNLGSGIVVLPLVGLLENIAVCKAFAHGKPVDATQELIAIGLCNMGNSFVHGYPGSGSLSRSAVNNSSGVRTPLGGLYTGLLVILSLLFLTPQFIYIPNASLAAVIIAAVVFMVEVRVVKPIYRSKKSDLIPGLATFIACLILPLEIGILIGIGLNLVSILYHAARPKISIEMHKSRAGVEYLLITPDRCLIFPSVDYVRNLVTKHGMKKGIPVVIDCSHIYGADFTAAKVIEVLTQDFSTRGQALFFYNLKPSIAAIFEGVQPKDFFTYYDKHELDEILRQRNEAIIRNAAIDNKAYDKTDDKTDDKPDGLIIDTKL